jgi:hypothetical protein
MEFEGPWDCAGMATASRSTGASRRGARIIVREVVGVGSKRLRGRTELHLMDTGAGKMVVMM